MKPEKKIPAGSRNVGSPPLFLVSVSVLHNIQLYYDDFKIVTYNISYVKYVIVKSYREDVKKQGDFRFSLVFLGVPLL